MTCRLGSWGGITPPDESSGACGHGINDALCDAVRHQARPLQNLSVRRVVEHPFAWLGRSRRLRKDREHSVASSESFICLAMIRLMLRRLAR